MTFRPVDDAEAAQADFVVCMRMADLMPLSMLPPPVQGPARETRQNSTKLPCEGCGETILVSNTSPDGPKKVCTHCHQSIKRVADRVMGRNS